MLQGLDLIDWEQLTHAYGTASDVPDLLKALVSSNTETWEEALKKLYGNLWHQGTIYQATVVAIPFLLKILEYKEVYCRDKILIYLAALADTYSADRGMQWAKSAHYIIAQSFQIYLDLLENAETNVKIYVPYLLSTLEEHTTEIISFVQAYLSQETDVLVKASLLIYLSNQPKYVDKDNHLFSFFLNIKSDSYILNVLSAMALLKRLKEDTSIEIVQVLVKAVAHPQALEDLYRKLPWPNIHNRSLLSDISDSLLLLDFKSSNLVIPALLQALSYINQSYLSRGSIYITDVAVLSVIRTLLHFAFEGKKSKENSIPFLLTNIQRSILTTILNNEVAEAFLDDFVVIMNSFGLPPLWKLRILLQK